MRTAAALVLAAAAGCAARGAPLNPYTADQIERLLRGAVAPAKILDDARRDCIGFAPTAAHATAFAAAGAPAWFADSLASVCRVRGAGGASG